MNHQINVVIPMAGNGSRFAVAGYKKPKPFIDVNGLPMIELVINNINIKNAKYYLIAKHEHYNKEIEIVKYLERKYNVEFILIDKHTEGAACTTLFARKFINNDNPLIFANSDQIVDVNINDFIKDAQNRKLDGSILVFQDNNPKWSFVKIDNNGLVLEVKEKNPISDIATVGIYYFQKGNIFVNGAIDMIINNDRYNNEFYLCPVYNYVIKDSNLVGIYSIEKEQMHGLGTPEDLNQYLNKCH